ncbi:anthranilate synthase component I family protein [Lacisediminihabitans sp.]|uniref:anthranilate synthase component I family protein n=1 Tax=Lacisediminihabitans sp. TaxID=2787631 RepID=UPI00374D65C2
MRQRLIEAPLPGWTDPADAFSSLLGDSERAVWLDSGMHAVTGMSYLAAGSRLVTASVPHGTITVDGARQDGTILDFLRRELPSARLGDGAGFRLGWVGWLGYELRSQTMGTTVTHESAVPDASLLFVDRAIAFDHESRTMSVLALGDDWLGDLGEWRRAVSRRLAEPVRAPAATVTAPAGEPPRVTWAYGDDEYLAMIRECQASIAAGDAYQLCLTTEAVVEARPDPLATYLALRRSSPTHHGALYIADGIALLSASPELFLSVSPDGVVESRPIKGTRARGATPNEDAALATELEESDKERAENLMIVDLMRNDIARVSEVGSVSVPSLIALESYAHVHQLVSTVRGRLAAGKTGIDAVEACFPAGSMTGAPKLSAVTILERLEDRARGVYSGAFGYFGLDGRIDLAMVIRSILIDRDRTTVGAGGGITALSVPEEELDEVRLKAAALLAVLGAPALPPPSPSEIHAI